MVLVITPLNSITEYQLIALSSFGIYVSACTLNTESTAASTCVFMKEEPTLSGFQEDCADSVDSQDDDVR